MAEKIPVIIDCDTGTDDSIAIVAAVFSGKLDIRAVTCVNGNTSEDNVAKNNTNLLNYIGAKNIPVARGAKDPISTEHRYHATCHGNTGFGNVEIPNVENPVYMDKIASEVIYEEAVRQKGELCLIVVGPMTNIALAILNHPDIVGLIKHIYFMGGAIEGGNTSTVAEFNIWVDPPAAHIVTQSGIPQTMVGLDATLKAYLDEDDYEDIAKIKTNAGDVVCRLLKYMFQRVDNGLEGAIMHDSLAVAACLCPQCITFRDSYVDVECKGEYTSGHTMVDLKDRYHRPKNVSVAVDCDTVLFRKWIKECIKNSEKA